MALVICLKYWYGDGDGDGSTKDPGNPTEQIAIKHCIASHLPPFLFHIQISFRVSITTVLKLRLLRVTSACVSGLEYGQYGVKVRRDFLFIHGSRALVLVLA